MNRPVSAYNAAATSEGNEMRTITIAIGSALALAATPAFAANTYLKCEIPKGDGVFTSWALSVNEDAGRVTATHPKATRTVRASFTPDKIVWDRGDFSLDRTTLILTLRPTLYGKPIGEPISGQCKIDERKRAI